MNVTSGPIDKASKQSPVVIKIVNLSKWYGQVIGLNDFSFNFGQGITGLLGPNGAGKSTLLKSMTGQIKPDLGKVFVNGMDPWNNPDIWQFMGYCPEQESFWPNLTGLEFVTMLAKLQGMPRSKAEVVAKHAIDMMGMTEHSGRRIGGYSKGMKQRIKLAQCILHDPDILILDEPLGGTDPIGRHHIIKMLHQWEEDGKTIIISSHVLEEVERITNNIVLINRGRLLADGQIDQIRDLIDKHPHHIVIKTKDYNRLGCRLMEEPFVNSISKTTSPPGLVVETNQPEKFYTEIANILYAEKIEIDGMGSQDDSLDAVFRYLIG